MRNVKGWKHRCGGSLIDEVFIVTAAHCLEEPTSQYRIKVGDSNLSKPDKNEDVFQIKNWVIHPQFRKSKFFLEN